jgi:hypothetical protein
MSGIIGQLYQDEDYQRNLGNQQDNTLADQQNAVDTEPSVIRLMGSPIPVAQAAPPPIVVEQPTDINAAAATLARGTPDPNAAIPQVGGRIVLPWGQQVDIGNSPSPLMRDVGRVGTGVAKVAAQGGALIANLANDITGYVYGERSKPVDKQIENVENWVRGETPVPVTKPAGTTPSGPAVNGAQPAHDALLAAVTQKSAEAKQYLADQQVKDQRVNEILGRIKESTGIDMRSDALKDARDRVYQKFQAREQDWINRNAANVSPENFGTLVDNRGVNGPSFEKRQALPDVTYRSKDSEGNAILGAIGDFTQSQDFKDQLSAAEADTTKRMAMADKMYEREMKLIEPRFAVKKDEISVRPSDMSIIEGSHGMKTPDELKAHTQRIHELYAPEALNEMYKYYQNYTATMKATDAIINNPKADPAARAQATKDRQKSEFAKGIYDPLFGKGLTTEGAQKNAAELLGKTEIFMQFLPPELKARMDQDLAGVGRRFPATGAPAAATLTPASATPTIRRTGTGVVDTPQGKQNVTVGSMFTDKTGKKLTVTGFLPDGRPTTK